MVRHVKVNLQVAAEKKEENEKEQVEKKEDCEEGEGG